MIIGICGQGFVGTAVREGLRDFYKLRTFDISKKEDFCVETLEDLVYQSKIIFQCLPTPMRKSGECDIRLVEKTVMEIDSICNDSEALCEIVVIKSTVPPGTTEALNFSVNNIQVVFNPEFLTEANAINDFKNQNRIILGGPRPATSILKTLFSRAFPKSSIVKTGSNTAEMVKYFTNCFLASKVSFSNEMRQICESSKIDYDKVVEYALYDQRIGKSHLSSPGPDGSYGFGGHCFPKDINALMFLAREKGVNPAVLQAVWDKNLEVRSEEKRDWEAMSGRAVSED
jgi:UDPglucose 6-dehydrogenase